MTLILTTKCKNGICVCVDKRSIKPGGVFEDNLNKLYRFAEIPLIIFNHGVNKFNNKMWDKFCLEYENLNSWKALNLNNISYDFKKKIEIDIEKELEKNFKNNLSDEYLKSGFVFCGKANRNIKNNIIEFFWSFSKDGLECERKNHGNLVLTGTGDKYLTKYLKENPEIFTNEYWENLEVKHAKNELIKLFLIAVKEKNNSGGNEFSDDFVLDILEE